MYVRNTCLVLVVCTAGWFTSAHAQSTQTGVLKLPDEIEFKAPLRPGGTSTAVLYGDPTKPGVFVTRVKFEPGLKVMPHWHPDEVRTVAVLSGTLYFAVGEQWDESKLKAYPAGTFYSEPPRTPHYAWAKDGEVILQITGIGPSGTTFIEQKKQ
jgi:quercetin dioxygenase-like cupin family protein